MRIIALLCFFLSGASGLIFEVIWTRMFSLVFGATTLAMSTVLTAFMGGLALGSYLAGRWSDRIRQPLWAYALAEAGVGLSALLVPYVVSSFAALNQFLYSHFRDHYFILSGTRFLASAAILIVPTTLMGTTLPLLSRFFIQTPTEYHRVGFRVGSLYAINTFGALIGTGLGGFVFLPYLGLSLTNRVAATTNIALALLVTIVYSLRRYLPPRPTVDPSIAALLNEVTSTNVTPPHIPPRARGLCLMSFALSGAVAMTYQVMWTRALSMAIGSSIYSFTLVLMAFLVGLAGGAALMGRISARLTNPVGWLAGNHILVVLMVMIAYLLMDKLPFIFLFLLKGEELGAASVLSSQFTIALLLMLPATLAMGGILPLTIRIYSSSLEHVGREIGTAYSVNTLGAIVGSFVAGFIVVPVLQLQHGHFMAIAVNLFLAAMLSWVAPWPKRHLRIASMIFVGMLAISIAFLPRWNLNHVSAGLFRLAIAREVLTTGKWQDPALVYYRDGISTTVSVEKWSKEHFSLKNNGKVDASTGDDMPTQILVGLLPILLHPQVPVINPKVALVGYASGVTAGAILQYPVSRLDVIELEPAIREASRFFEGVNHRPFSDTRLNWITDDGRNFLQAGQEQYDVIINEPSNPWITGVSNLFTKDYFEIGRRRLAPGGIFCTWAQMYEISPRHIKAIYRSFARVFPYVYAFSAEALSADTFLIGSNQPLTWDIRRLRQAWNLPKVGKELKRAKIRRPDDLLALILLGPNEIHAFTLGADVNTDDNALIEFGTPRDLYNHKQYDYYISKIYGQQWMYSHLDGFITGYSSSEDYANLVYSLLNQGKHREARYFLSRVKMEAGHQSRHVHLLMNLLAPREIIEEEVLLTEDGPPLTPPLAPKRKLSKEEANRLAREYFTVEQRTNVKSYRAALDLIESWPEDVREEAGDDFMLLWGYLAYKNFDFNASVNILESLWKKKAFVQRRPALLYYLGRAFYGNADFNKSIQTLEAWMNDRQKKQKPIIPPFMERESSEGDTPTLDIIP